MKQNFTHDLAGAISAKQHGQLLDWTIAYLEKEHRNKPLLDQIHDRTIVQTELLDFPLSKLERLSGPQNGEAEPEPIHEWVARVGAIEEKIRSKETLPPILVTDFWQELGIADGNHRHEALLNQGIKTYWTIFLFTKHASVPKIARHT